MDVAESWDGSRRTTPGGGPFNTARALSRLGVSTAFLGRLSTDDAGRQLARLLSDDGVDMSLVNVGPEPTTVARASIGKDGTAAYAFLTEGTSAINLTPATLPANLEPEVTAIHAGTLGLLLEPISSTILELLDRESGRRVVMVDPNIRLNAITNASAARARLFAAIERSTIVKASEDDVAWLYPGLDLTTATSRMLELGVRLAVVTLGARGAVGMTSAARVQVQAPAVRVVDTIGAGDTFGAALLAWFHEHGLLQQDFRLSGTDLEPALAFACRAASLTCTRAGCVPPTRGELRD